MKRSKGLMKGKKNNKTYCLKKLIVQVPFQGMKDQGVRPSEVTFSATWPKKGTN